MILFGLTYLRRSLTTLVGSVLFLISFAAVYRTRFGAPYLRWFLERCGGGFAKLGQMLAMRFDLLPLDYHDELARILDRMPRVSTRRIRRIVAAELGRDALTRLAIDDAPLGSASIAQAHAATLPDGTRVVVKVRRPGIERIMRIDLINLGLLAWCLQTAGLFQRGDLTRILREVRRYTDEELDFRREAFSAQALHDMMAGDDVDHYAPRPYLDLCTERVVVLERLDGVWMWDLLTAVRTGDRDQLAAWAERGITPGRVARVLFRSVLEQAYHHQLFHADPHAANVLVLDGGTVAFIDFGIMGWLDEELRAKQERVVLHLSRGEIDAAYRALLRLVEAEQHADLSEFESVVKAELTAYLLRARSPHATPAEKSTGRVFIAVAGAVRRLNLRLPARLTRFYRAQLVVDELSLRLAPDLDPIGEFTAFWDDESRRRQWADLCAGADLAAVGAAVAGMPAMIRELSEWVRFSLPHLGRSYGQTLTRLEHGIVLGLEYLRRGALVVAGAALGATLWRRLSGSWDALNRLSDYTLPIVVAGSLLVAFGLGRIGSRMRSLE